MKVVIQLFAQTEKNFQKSRATVEGAFTLLRRTPTSDVKEVISGLLQELGDQCPKYQRRGGVEIHLHIECPEVAGACFEPLPHETGGTLPVVPWDKVTAVATTAIVAFLTTILDLDRHLKEGFVISLDD